MEDKQLTEKESLDLIARMIDNTRDRITKNAGGPFLIWGYVTIAVALVTWYAVSSTQNYWWHLLWFLIPILGSPINYFTAKKKERKVLTFVDRVVDNVWLVFAISVVLVSVMAFIVRLPILFLVPLMMSMAVTLTGMITKFRIAIISGFIGLLGSFSLLFVTGLNQILIFAALFVVMMIIPGHLLNRKAKKQS
jgi:hypothetical protein